MDKVKRILLTLVLICSFTLLVKDSVIVSASSTSKSWTADADKSIYGKDALGPTDNPSIIDDLVVGSSTGLFEKLLIELIVAITNGIYILLHSLGLTLDNIVYGRVGGHTLDGIALFRFELQKGNPYGIVGAAIYTVIAGIATVICVVTIFGKLSISMYASGSSQKREALKSSLGISILSIALIVLMPYFLDVALYLSDVILYVISNQGSMVLFGGGSGFDIISTYRDVAKNSIVNACIYLSSILLSLYFAIIYAGYALTMLVLFISFPFISVGMNLDKKLISSWCKQVISILLIPILDCVLLMVPAYMGFMPRQASMGFIKIILCAMIVPARNILRHLLGLSGSGLELTGIGAMIGAMQLARSSLGAVVNYSQGKRAAAADRTIADYYQTLADSEYHGGGSSTGEGFIGPVGGGPRNPVGGGLGGSGGALTLRTVGGMSSVQENAYGSSTMGMGSSNTMLHMDSDVDVSKRSNESTIDTSIGSIVRDKSQPGTNSSSSSHPSPKNMATSHAGTVSGTESQRSESGNIDSIAEKYANIYNFENGVFKGLSDKKLAELYRERAKLRKRMARASAIGSIAGGGLMMGASMFSSPGARSMMGSMGIEIGGIIGAGIGSIKRKPDISIINSTNKEIMEESIPLEKVTGTVDYTEDLVNIASGEVGVNDVPIYSAEDFKNVNKAPLEQSIEFSGMSYMADNGERLRIIYEDVMKKSKYTTQAKRNKRFRDVAAERMTESLKETVKSNINIKYSRNDEINKAGLEKVYEDYRKALIAIKETGPLSERNLRMFDWYIPDKESE